MNAMAIFCRGLTARNKIGVLLRVRAIAKRGFQVGMPRCGVSASFRRATLRPAERGPAHRSAMTST